MRRTFHNSTNLTFLFCFVVVVAAVNAVTISVFTKMIAFFWLALLLAASPLLAKSIAPTVARYQEGNVRLRAANAPHFSLIDFEPRKPHERLSIA